MTVTKTREGDVLTVKVEGRLDTMTSPELESELSNETPEKLILDFSDLEYISSAGLRVLLSAQKRANASGGEMVVRGCGEAILDVFEVTGFGDFLTIED